MTPASALGRNTPHRAVGIVDLSVLAPHTWFKADVGVLEAIAGSDAAESGDGVERWQDQSGNARHADQATAESRPVYLTNIQNGLPVLRVNDDRWLRTAVFAEVAQPTTVCLVAKSTDSAGSSQRWVLGAGATGRRNQVGATGTRWQANAGSDLITATGVVTGDYQVVVVVFNGASSKLRVGGSEVTGNSGVEGATRHTIGANQFANAKWKGDICEVAFFARALNSTEITDAEAHLRAKWGF